MTSSPKRVRVCYFPGAYVGVDLGLWLDLAPRPSDLKKAYSGVSYYDGQGLTMHGWGQTRANGVRGKLPVFPVSMLYRDPLRNRVLLEKIMTRRLPLLFYQDYTYVHLKHVVKTLATWYHRSQTHVRDYLSGSLQYAVYNAIGSRSQMDRWRLNTTLYPFQVL